MKGGTASPPTGGAFPWPSVAVAAAAALPFAALCAALLLAAAPSAAQREAADPLIHFAPALAHPLALPALAAALALLWWRLAPPARADLRRGATQAVAAAALVGVGLPLLRAAIGPHLPAFIPSEESARPGMPLGLSAGVAEELIFRIAMLPALLAVLGRTTARPLAAAAIVGLAFAATHELAPAAAAFSAPHFASRLLIPGVAMSMLFLFVGPTFVVTLHCSAHLLLPLLFH